VLRRTACFLVSAVCLSAPAGAQFNHVLVNVRLVRLLATVKDANGQLIGSLNKNRTSAFTTTVPPDVAVFERQTEQPLSVAVLGIAARRRPRNALRAGFGEQVFKALLSEGNTRDTAALYNFNWQVTLLSSSYATLPRGWIRA